MICPRCFAFRMFLIDLTPEAIEDLSAESKYDQVRLVAAMENQLPHEPDIETRNRKRLRPDQLAEWALRVDRFRIFYDVISRDAIVKVVAAGRKDGNKLYVRGEVFDL